MSENCSDILIRGVYETHIKTRTGNLEQDYKHYFSTDEFRKDYRDKKFRYGVEAFIDGITANLSIDVSDIELDEFQLKVRDSTTFSLKQSFFEQSVHTIPNKAIVEAWKACVENKLGFTITNEVIGNYVKFKLTYINYEGASNPKLQNVSVLGGKLESRTKQDNEFIEVLEEIVFTCSFTSENILISIDTDFTAITDSAAKITKQKSADNNPIGTIISSFLNWEEFQRETENNKVTDNGLFNGEKSFWAPCDGRLVNNSDFYKLTNQINAPDLRGVFLRALNTFDRYENDYGISSVSDNQKDPQISRIREEFQADEFESHTHIGNMKLGAEPHGGLARASSAAGGTGKADAYWTTAELVNHEGGPETRPKNKAFYYYIKINK